MPSGKLFFSVSIVGADFVGELQRVRARRLEDGNGHGVLVVEQRLRRRRSPRPISMRATSPRRTTSASAPVLMTMSRNCSSFSRRPLAFSASWNSAPVGGRRADLAGRDLHVLLADRRDHVAGGEAARGELLRIEPHAHRVVARAEHAHVAHAGQARERVAHVQHGVVAQIERVVAAIRGGEVHHHHEGRASS